MNKFAEFSRRHIITAALVVFFEMLLFIQYARIDAEFHFWVHGLFGAALGLTALTLWKLLHKNHARLSPFEAGFIGHIYSAIPDIIFIAFGVLHMYWMDIFAIHISIHFIPAPIFTMLAIFLLCLVAYGLVAQGYRKFCSGTLVVAAILLTAALLLRSPIPATLEDVKNHSHSYGWLCPMIDV